MKLAILGILLCLILGFSSVLAQEATPEVTPTAAPVVTIPAPGTVLTGETNQITIDVGSLAFYILGAVAVGGLGGVTGFAIFSRRILGNKDALDTIERIAHNSIPIEALNIIHDLAVNIQAGATLVSTVTDGQPNAVDAISQGAHEAETNEGEISSHLGTPFTQRE